jgi:hypothetical protein
MKRVVFYAAGRPFASLREAAVEVERVSGGEVELWRLGRILDANKGFINGVPVSRKIVEQEEEKPAEENEVAGEREERKRTPLMRPPVRGLPPRWR